MMTTPKELDYNGPNAELVADVLAFAFSEDILKGGPTSSKDIVITPDIVRAVDAAGLVSEESKINVAYGNNKIALPENWPFKGEIEWIDYDGWLNLRTELELAYIRTGDWYAWSKEHKPELQIIESLAIQKTKDSPMFLFGHLEKMLPAGPKLSNGKTGYYRNYIIHEVASDLMNICKNRAFHGVNNNFWEHLLTLYMQGYWPCCWLGSWPADGKFLVWNPHSS